MLKRVLTSIQHKTNWKLTFCLLATSLFLAFLMNGTKLPFSSSTIQSYSGGQPLLDMRLTYSPDDTYEFFTALEREGRQAYLILHLAPDTLFPIGYSLTFAFISAWFLVRLLPLNHPLQWLSMMPLVSGLADISENIILVIYSLLFPKRIDWLAQTAQLFTKIKFGLLPIGLIFLIIIIAIWFIRKRPQNSMPKEK